MSGAVVGRGSRLRRRLRVSRDLHWIESPDRQMGDLSRRAVLRRVLRCLLAAPHGRVVTRAALLEAGWPGEKILPRAASNRLWVALSTLRRLGLADVLETGRGGYRLAADVRVEWV